VVPPKLRPLNFAFGRELQRASNSLFGSLAIIIGQPGMTLVLIWLAMSIIVGASVCRLLALFDAAVENPPRP
jgi:hypothetical protein